MEHRHFQEGIFHLVEEFFFLHSDLDCNDDLEVVGEHVRVCVCVPTTFPSWQ